LALLRRVRDGSRRLIPSRFRSPGVFLALVGSVACGGGSSEDQDTAALRAQLNLDSRDVVHSIAIRTGVGERAEPDSIEVREGDLVRFLSEDWYVHEIRFELDSISAPGRAFLLETDQDASPPLLARGAQFVLSFSGAPVGRYPFTLEGNRGPGRGLIVVAPPTGLP
jgi:plastocyanin